MTLSPTNVLNEMQALYHFSHISRPTRFPDSPDLGHPSLLIKSGPSLHPPTQALYTVACLHNCPYLLPVQLIDRSYELYIGAILTDFEL